MAHCSIGGASRQTKTRNKFGLSSQSSVVSVLFRADEDRQQEYRVAFEGEAGLPTAEELRATRAV